MKKSITTQAFPEPNHTQTPNNFFEMIPDMEDSELRVTLIMIRNTFGWHRNEFKMSISKLMTATGLSRNGVRAGAEAAEKRGTFRRSNPENQSEAEWELVVGQPLTPSASDPVGGQSVTHPPSASDPQVAVKEIVNKEIKDSPPAVEEAESFAALNPDIAARKSKPAPPRLGTLSALQHGENNQTEIVMALELITGKRYHASTKTNGGMTQAQIVQDLRSKEVTRDQIKKFENWWRETHSWQKTLSKPTLYQVWESWNEAMQWSPNQTNPREDEVTLASEYVPGTLSPRI